jgi:hypothetical protein
VTSTVSITTLHKVASYPVVGVRRTSTKCGVRIVMALNEVDRGNLAVFLPKRYSDLIEDSDIEAINTNQTQYYLTYSGTSPSSKAIILQLGM